MKAAVTEMFGMIRAIHGLRTGTKFGQKMQKYARYEVVEWDFYWRPPLAELERQRLAEHFTEKTVTKHQDVRI